MTRQSIIKKDTIGDRGIISDRNFIPLSQNVNRYTFWINTIQDEIDIRSIAEIFSNVFNKSFEQYVQKLQIKSKYNVIEKDVLESDCLQILQIKKIKGLNTDKSIRRYYPYSDLAAQLIGYTDLLNSGVIGIEARFNNILLGESKQITYNNKGLIPLNSKDELPEKGADLMLTIDIILQTILQDELLHSIQKTDAKSANGIIVNPFTGEILAMATVPSLDLNNYHQYPVSSQLNRVIGDMYEPGSTFKIITMAGKLESTTKPFKEIYDCENGKFKYHDKIFTDHEEHSNLTLSEILVYSSNIGMIKIANEIGDKNVFHFTRQFGFGSPTGISLPGESYGIVNPIAKWSGISGPEISIGQGIAINNLQLAMAYSAVANGGFLLKPQIIKEIQFSDETGYFYSPEVVRRSISEETSLKLLSMLENVISKGTGGSAGISGFYIAGKTGTAQKVVDGEYSTNSFNSSFAAIFPVENPQYVCIVSVDSPDYTRGYHWGSETAAPIVKRIFERLIFQQDKNHQLYDESNIYVNNQSKLPKKKYRWN